MKLLRGVSASPGTAVASVMMAPVPPARRPSTAEFGTPEAEWKRLKSACLVVDEHLMTAQEHVAGVLTGHDAGIFDAQRLFLEDPDFLDLIRASLASGGRVEVALQKSLVQARERFQALDDPLLRSRYIDLLDVWDHVLTVLQLGELPELLLEGGDFILVANEIRPSLLGRLPLERLRGLLSEQGNPASHVSILARALNIPYLFGVRHLLESVKGGMLVGLDTQQRTVWLEPDAQMEWMLRKKEAEQRALQETVCFAEEAPLTTTCGVPIVLEANASLVEEVQWGRRHGATGIGLFRTEFLFTHHLHWPDEDEQYTLYRKVVMAMEPELVTFRVFDLGGDKQPPYLAFVEEKNPQLGWRGVRLFLDHREEARRQVRALLRATANSTLRVMAPMVTTLEEFREFAALVREEHKRCQDDGFPVARELQLGAMLETPAAVFALQDWDKEADFFSVGTNDLMQFLMAADRNQAGVRHLHSMLQPSVLRWMKMLAEQSKALTSPISICGESAGNLRVLPVLLGLGFRRFSVSASRLLVARQTLNHWSLADAEELAHKALSCQTLAEVKELLEGPSA